MRILHTADWHLGRIFHGMHLTDDQAYLLDQVVGMVKDTKPDALLIAGDVYDRSVPPHEAVTLLDETLARINLDCGIPVIMIAGNHDSPNRLSFASRILAERGVYVFGSPTPACASIDFEDKHGKVQIFALPYSEPAVVRECMVDPELRDHQAAMQALLASVQKSREKKARTVLLGHAYVTGGATSESERPLSVGGADQIKADLFSDFDYTALGHLHQPQSVLKNKVRYSGSLMKYSFSEAKHEKSVSLVEIGKAGQVKIEELALTPRRDLRIVKGSFNEVVAGAEQDPAPEDYLMVSLTNREPVYDAIGRLREVYTNILHIEWPEMLAIQQGKIAHRDFRKVTEVELFESFFRDMTKEDWNKEQKELFVEVVEKVRQEEREV